MSYAYGRNFSLTIDGGSHDPEICMSLVGFPAGVKVDRAALSAFMARRAPGRQAYSTPRKESDIPLFLSGLTADDTTDGTPISVVIRNENQHSGDYLALADTPRPSHADYAAVMKYGRSVDLRGGGHFSGRLTALLCVAGFLAMSFLKPRGVAVFAHAAAIGGVTDTPFSLSEVGEKERVQLTKTDFPTLSSTAALRMKETIEFARLDGDSVGGVIECAVTGLPAGLGEHMFFSAEAAVAGAVFAVPAVKGVEFGAGFTAAALRGSENNDPFYTDGNRVLIRNNRAGGILGGMTSGAPLVFRAAIKPTPSIAVEQDTVSLSRMENTKIRIGGRHDPCIVPRAVPVIEAAAALAVCDLFLSAEGEHHE